MNPSIVAKFRTPRLRDAALAGVSSFNKKNAKDKLNTQYLGIGGTRCSVYVSEHLTPYNKSIHAATRLKAKEKGYKFTWVRNGRVYVRKDELSQAILIRNIECLHKIQ